MKTLQRGFLIAVSLMLALSVGASKTLAWEDHIAFFKSGIIDSDGDKEFDLSVCFGDNTSQGVYTGRFYLLDRLKAHFNLVVEGDEMVDDRAYDDGFVSSGVCDNDGSSVHIHYFNGTSTGAVAYAQQKGGEKIGPLLTECHIFLNSYYTYSWQMPTEATSVDGAAVVTHELLHCWGLNHSNVTDSLMQEGSRPLNDYCNFKGDTQWIRPDDAAGAKYIYADSIHYWYTAATLKPESGNTFSRCTD